MTVRRSVIFCNYLTGNIRTSLPSRICEVVESKSVKQQKRCEWSGWLFIQGGKLEQSSEATDMTIATRALLNISTPARTNQGSRTKKRKSSNKHSERGSSKLIIMQLDVPCVYATATRPQNTRNSVCVLKISHYDSHTHDLVTVVIVSRTISMVLFKFEPLDAFWNSHRPQRFDSIFWKDDKNKR